MAKEAQDERSYAGLQQQIFNYLSDEWDGTDKAKREFLEKLYKKFETDPSWPLSKAVDFLDQNFRQGEHVVRLKSEIYLSDLRLYFLAADGSVNSYSGEELQAKVDKLKKSGYEAFSKIKNKEENVRVLDDLSDDLQAAFSYIWDKKMMPDENEWYAAYSALAEHFPNLENNYLLLLLQAEERNVKVLDFITAAKQLDNYEHERELLDVKSEYFLHAQDTLWYGSCVFAYGNNFLRHRTVQNWLDTAHALVDGFEMIDNKAGEKSVNVRKFLKYEEKVYADLPVQYGWVLADVVDHRPKMKWNNERINLMYNLFFKGMVLPDKVLTMDHTKWNYELGNWIIELLKNGVDMTDRLQAMLSNLLLFASLKLRTKEERDSFREVIDFLRKQNIFTDSTVISTIPDMDYALELAWFGDDDRFTQSLREAAPTLRENDSSLLIFLKEFDNDRTKENVLKTSYPLIFREYSKYRDLAYEDARAAMESLSDHPSYAQSSKVQKPYVRAKKKIGRNDPCPCGSGKKFKNCCMGKGIYD